MARARQRFGRQVKALWCGCILSVALGVSSRPALADDKDDARALGAAGIVAFEEGRYPEATEKLSQAYALYPASSLLLWWGRALAKQGRLVEASQRLGEAASEALPEDADPAMAETQQMATSERAEVDQRIAHAMVALDGAGTASTEISVDGKPVTINEGESLALDPGAHSIAVQLDDGRSGSLQVELEEGETKTVTLSFEPRVAEPGDQKASNAAEDDGAEQIAPARPLGKVKGLYVRGTLGVGTATLTPSEDTGYGVKGTPLVLDLELGTVVGAGLALGGEFWLGLTPSPSVDYDAAGIEDASSGSMALVMLGPFADYYFRPGWHLHAMLGFATARWNASETPAGATSDTLLNLNGFGGTLGGGYDFALRPSDRDHDTRLGGLLALQIARLSGDDGILVDTEQRDYGAVTLMIAATLTHH